MDKLNEKKIKHSGKSIFIIKLNEILGSEELIAHPFHFPLLLLKNTLIVGK
jgi:hypothetical protein